MTDLCNFTTESNKKGGVKMISYGKGLIYQIFNLLDLIETPTNQPTIQRIRGLLYELLEDY